MTPRQEVLTQIERVQEVQRLEKMDFRAQTLLDAACWIANVAGNHLLAKRLYDRGARHLETRASGEGINTFGGALVPTEVASLVLAYRDQAVFRQNASLYRMSSDTCSIPRRTGTPTPLYVGEGTVLSEANFAWDDIGLTARKLAVFGRMSSELNEDASIDVAGYLLRDLGVAFGLAEDAAGFVGDGTSTYGGIRGIIPELLDGSSAGKVAAATGHSTFLTLDGTDFANLFAKLPDKYWPNAKLYISGYGYSASIARLSMASGSELKDIDNSPQPLAYGVPVVLTPQLPGSGTQTGQIMALFGDLSSAAILGSRRELSLLTSVHRFLDQDAIAFRCTQRYDLVVHNLGDPFLPGAVVGLQGTA